MHGDKRAACSGYTFQTLAVIQYVVLLGAFKAKMLRFGGRSFGQYGVQVPTRTPQGSSTQIRGLMSQVQ